MTIASLLGRIPLGLGAVALVLYVHQVTGSFAPAGAAAGAYTVGLGITGPPLARLIDRRGPGLILLPCTVLASALLGAVVALGNAGAEPSTLVVLSGLAGAAMPPLSGVVRQGWSELVSAHDLPTAYAIDAVLIEILFVAGPLLAGILAATIGPGDGLLVGATVGLLGTLWFAVLPVGRGNREPEAGSSRGPKVLSSPAMRQLILAGLPIGATVGALDVALPAFGVAHGSSALGGPFAASFAVGSTMGGIVYGARPHALGEPARAFVILRVLQVLTCLPILLAFSIPSMLVLVGISGLCFAPLLTARIQLVHQAMPPGTGAESFTWPGLSLAIGTSAGSILAGAAVQAEGWQLGVALGALLPAVSLLPSFLAAAVPGRKLAARKLRRS